jgi:hypothetical protein
MRGETWIELFKRIPDAFRDGFGIVTSGGTEVNLESIMRLEDEFMVFRGRLVGSTDAQRTFFLPYDQINIIVYQRLMKEEAVQAWFGGEPPSTVAVPADQPAEAPAETAPAEAPAPEPISPVPIQRMDSAPMPGKAAILERLRKRNVANAGVPVQAPAAPNPPPK